MNPIEEAITYHSYTYSKTLVEELRNNGFVDNFYSQKNDIVSICGIVENYLINSFIQEVKNLIVSADDALQLIQLYSVTHNPSSKQGLLFRQACRYIIYLLPSLNLVAKDTEKSHEDNINQFCKLIALNNLIQEVNQLYGIQSLLDNSCAMIDLTIFYRVDYTDSFVHKLNQALSNSPDLVHKSFHLEEIFEGLMNILDKESSSLKQIFDINAKYLDLFNSPFEITSQTINNEDLLVQGLLYTESNVNLINAIEKPLDPQFRTRFRPFICLNIDGSKRVFTTHWLILETLYEISSNLLPYANLPKEWQDNSVLTKYAQLMQKKNGEEFEKQVANIVKTKYLAESDIKGFNNVSLNKERVSNTERKIGQIDVLAIDQINKIIYVIDAKCTKTKYFFRTFENDKKRYQEYEIKLCDKVNWICSHKNVVAKFFKLNSLDDYSVEGFFVSNSLIYFGFFSATPIVPIDKLLLYLEVKNIESLFE